MANRPNYLEIRIVITNERALRALLVVEEFLEEQSDGSEWDKELARALRAVKYARRNLVAREADE